jgi:hypothetical protein
VSGDYAAVTIPATDPTQGNTSSDTQTVLNHLNTRIDTISGGGGGTSGITEIRTASQTIVLGSATYPAWNATEFDFPTTFIYAPAIENAGGITSGLPAGSADSQLRGLAHRDAQDMVYNSAGALNSSIRGTVSVGQALNTIPDGILTYAGNNGTIGNWTNSGAWTFNSTVTFTGNIVGLPPNIAMTETTASGSGNLAAGQVDSFALPTPTPVPGGGVWVLIGTFVETFTSQSNRVVATSAGQSVVLTNVHDTFANTWNATARAVWYRTT